MSSVARSACRAAAGFGLCRIWGSYDLFERDCVKPIRPRWCYYLEACNRLLAAIKCLCSLDICIRLQGKHLSLFQISHVNVIQLQCFAANFLIQCEYRLILDLQRLCSHSSKSGSHYDSAQPHNFQTCFQRRVRCIRRANLGRPGSGKSHRAGLVESILGLFPCYISEVGCGPRRLVLVQLILGLKHLSQSLHFWTDSNIKSSLNCALRTAWRTREEGSFQFGSLTASYISCLWSSWHLHPWWDTASHRALEKC